MLKPICKLTILALQAACISLANASCDNAPNNQAYTACLQDKVDEYAQVMDEYVGHVYEKRTEDTDSSFLPAFKLSQESFLRYMDSECSAVFASALPFSISIQKEPICRLEMIRQRTLDVWNHYLVIDEQDTPLVWAPYFPSYHTDGLEYEDGAYYTNELGEKEGTFLLLDLWDEGKIKGQARLLVGDEPEECLVVSTQFGIGLWAWSNAGFEIIFENKRFSYGNHADIPIGLHNDIGGCHNVTASILDVLRTLSSEGAGT